MVNFNTPLLNIIAFCCIIASALGQIMPDIFNGVSSMFSIIPNTITPLYRPYIPSENYARDKNYGAGNYPYNNNNLFGNTGNYPYSNTGNYPYSNTGNYPYSNTQFNNQLPLYNNGQFGNNQQRICCIPTSGANSLAVNGIGSVYYNGNPSLMDSRPIQIAPSFGFDAWSSTNSFQPQQGLWNNNPSLYNNAQWNTNINNPSGYNQLSSQGYNKLQLPGGYHCINVCAGTRRPNSPLYGSYNNNGLLNAYGSTNLPQVNGETNYNANKNIYPFNSGQNLHGLIDEQSTLTKNSFSGFLRRSPSTTIPFNQQSSQLTSSKHSLSKAKV